MSEVTEPQEMTEPELTKEQRVEAARKKFEEMKKKKKKKSKKKEVKEDDGEEKGDEGDNEGKEGKDEDVKQETEDSDVQDSKQTAGSAIQASKETEDSDVPDKQIEDSNVSDSKQVEDSNEPEVSELKEDDVKASLESKDVQEVTQDVKEPKSSKYIPEATLPKSSDSIEASIAAEVGAIGASEADSPDSIVSPQDVPSTGSPAISSYSTPAPSEDVATLQSTVEQQKNTIKKLRNENTDLKLAKMDLNDTIAELRAEIALLKSSSVPGSYQTTLPPPRSPLKPAKPVFTTNYYASESKHDVSKKDTEDFRESLMAWKGWQVDMTPWNGTGNVKKVAF